MNTGAATAPTSSKWAAATSSNASSSVLAAVSAVTYFATAHLRARPLLVLGRLAFASTAARRPQTTRCGTAPFRVLPAARSLLPLASCAAEVATLLATVPAAEECFPAAASASAAVARVTPRPSANVPLLRRRQWKLLPLLPHGSVLMRMQLPVRLLLVAQRTMLAATLERLSLTTKQRPSRSSAARRRSTESASVAPAKRVAQVFCVPDAGDSDVPRCFSGLLHTR